MARRRFKLAHMDQTRYMHTAYTIGLYEHEGLASKLRRAHLLLPSAARADDERTVTAHQGRACALVVPSLRRNLELATVIFDSDISISILATLTSLTSLRVSTR